MGNPTASDISTSNGSNVQGELDGLHGDVAALKGMLNPRATPRVTDPDLTANMETDAVAPANPTSGPHRVTFVVPTPDHTTVSFGAAASTRINDPGITGRTDTHVHWHVATGATTQGVVILGKGSQDVRLTDYDGSVVSGVNGYAMVTYGDAWHDAKGQQYIVSREKDAVLRTAGPEKAAVVQSDTGKVLVTGGHEVTVGTKGSLWLGADPDATIEDKRFTKVFDGDVGKWISNKAVKSGMTLADVYFSWLPIAAKAEDVEKRAAKGQGGWEVEKNWDKAKFIVDITKVASTIGRYLTEFFVPGKVSVFGSTYAGVTGVIGASMFGNLSASVTSLLSASMLGGTTSVKGFLWTSVWSGIQTSVKSIKDVELKGEGGKAKVMGKTDVQVVCGEGPVAVQGDKDARVNSITGAAALHGATMAYVGAGTGSGFGVKVKPEEINIGQITSNAKKFDGSGASFATKNKIFIKKDEMYAVIGTSKLTLTTDKVQLEAKSAHGLKVDKNGNVKVGSKNKVLVG